MIQSVSNILFSYSPENTSSVFNCFSVLIKIGYFEGSVDDMDIETVLHECSKNLETVSNYVPVVLVSLGRHGVVLCHYGDKIQKLPVKGDGVKVSLI